MSTKRWTTEKKIRQKLLSSARPFRVLNFVRLKISRWSKERRNQSFLLSLSRFLSFPCFSSSKQRTSGERVEPWQKQIERGDSFSSISPKLVFTGVKSWWWNDAMTSVQLLVIRRLSERNWLPSEQFNEDYTRTRRRISTRPSRILLCFSDGWKIGWNSPRFERRIFDAPFRSSEKLTLLYIERGARNWAEYQSTSVILFPRLS